MSDRQPTDLIRNERELLALTGVDDASFLADALWPDVDGVVSFHEDGIDLQPGLQHKELNYPFTLRQLHELARRLEEPEVPPQAAAPAPAPAVTLSKARVAKNAHDAFADHAAQRAEKFLGRGFRTFAPRPMTTFAWWYEDHRATTLLAVVAPTEGDKAADEVLAYALAWQHDRTLILVLSDKHSTEVARRLPWITAPVTVRSHEGEPVTMSRQDVLTTAAALKQRTTKRHTLDPAQTSWIRRLLDDPAITGLDHHALAGYVSWHHQGLQVLRVASARGGLRLEAGVQYSKPPQGHQGFNTLLTAALTDDQLARAVQAVTQAVAPGRALTTDQTEHRLQSNILTSPPPPLGLPFLAREYPGYRGPGRPGFIDFLGCDEAGHLHIVETKIGHDPKVVLQALDYGIWVQANEQSIRADRPQWPRPQDAQTVIYLDFVLAAAPHRLPARGQPSTKGTAISSYVAGQLEVLTDDVHWRVFVVQDLNDCPVVLTQVSKEALWVFKPGVTSQPVRPRRGTALT